MAVIAITGASGAVGSRVAARLAARGVPLRLVVRDPAPAPELEGAEVRVASDYGNGEEMRRALEGASTAYIISAGADEHRIDLHKSAVDAAVAAGAERIVYTSYVASAPDCTFTYARDHFHTEEHVKATGLGWTFLRDSMYLDLVPVFAGADGVIRGPAGSGKVAPVARDDIADVVAEVLTGDGHDGQTYDLTGPRAFTFAEAATVLSSFAGRPVVYEDETLEEARASRAPTGAPAWEIEGWVTSYAAVATGEMDVVSDAVDRIAGHPPMTLEEFLRRNPESYAHLAGSD